MSGQPKISEKQFQRQVVELAKLHRWRVAHFPRVKLRRRKGAVHLTAVAYDGAGWPDIVLARGGVVVFAELKSPSGTTSPEQNRWLADLSAVAARVDAAVGFDPRPVVVRVWSPACWPEIERVLGGQT